MVAGAYIGQLIGQRFGSYLGKQLSLGACRDDRPDDLEQRPFRPRLSSSTVPGAVDLRPWMTPVEDQGRLGSCAANALVGGLEYLVTRETGQHVDYSRLFVYFAQRLWDDAVREDLGATIADGVRVLSRLGVPTERTWPDHPDLFAVQPPERVLREAAATKVADWWSVPVDPDAFRGCLAAGFPIAFGTRVTESFVRTGRDGRCGMPEGADDPRHGRHALLAVGYDDRARVFVVRNSWGEQWGDQGYVYMPYAYVLDPRLTRNCWALRLTARDAFDPAQHGAVDLARLPRAPASGHGGGAAGTVGAIGSMGAQLAVGAFTGSGLLAGLAGGLVSGLTPGVSKALTGRDRGAHSGTDLADGILAALRADGPAPASLAPMPWDDGLDEEALVPAVDRNSGRRRVRASGRAGAASIEASPHTAPPAMPRAAPPTPTPASGIAGGIAGAGALIAGLFGAGGAPAPSPPMPMPTPRRAPTRAEATVQVDARFIDAMPASIAAHWRREGGVKGPLGPPISAPAPMLEPGYRGVVVRFQDGAMCAWDPPPGAPPLDPIVLRDADPAVAAWVARGAGRSVVGWPVRTVEEAPDREGRVFRGFRGSILAHPAHGVHAVHGPLFAHYLTLGEHLGELGYPIEDEVAPADPTAPTTQRFERGALTWSPAQGASRVRTPESV